jgi:cell division septation protein DedD
MSELLNNPTDGIQEQDDEAPVQYFCKFTFAQFFTIMILAVFTLGFMFYLGARYGNDYLRLGQVNSSSVSTASIQSVSTVPGTASSEDTQEMLKSAREALQSTQSERLQEQVSNVLQNPAAYQQQLAQQTQGGVPGQVPMQPVYPSQQQVVTPQDQAIAAIQQAQQDQQQYQQPVVPTAVARTANDRVNDYEPAAISKQPTAEDVPAAAPQAKSAGGSSFSVQVAASQNMTEANQWVQTWRDRGYSAFLMVADLPDKGRWYRVRLGTFPSRDTAENFASQLKEKEQVEAIAVQNE